MDSLRSVYGEVYVIFYGKIRIPRISGNFGTCTDSVYQALLSRARGGHYYTCCTDAHDRRFDPVRLRIL